MAGNDSTVRRQAERDAATAKAKLEAAKAAEKDSKGKSGGAISRAFGW